MAGLTWKVSLADAISPGARSAASSLSTLSRKLKEVQTRSKSPMSLAKMTDVAGLNSAIPKLGLFARAVQAAGGAFGANGANSMMAVGRAMDFVGRKAGALRGVLSGLMRVAKVAMAAVAAIGLAAVGMGFAGAKYVVEAQSFKQSTMFAFENLLGGKKAAADAWAMAKATSLQTGMGLQETAAGMNQLLAVGFDLPSADKLIKQLADLKTLNPAANLEGIARAIGQIKNTGKLQGDELMQLADAGLSTDGVYKQLEKQTGKTRAEILKMQAAGQITSEMAIKAIQDSMSEQTGKAPGELAAEATRKTMAGAFGKLMAVKDAFVDNLNFDFTPITAFLDKVSTALNGDAGKALGGAFEQLFNTVVGLLDRISAEDVSKFFIGLAAAIRGVARTIEFAASVVDKWNAGWAWIDSVKARIDGLGAGVGLVGDVIMGVVSTVGARIVGALLGPLYTIGGAIYSILQQIGNLDFSAIGSSLSAKGASIGSFFVQGILSALTGGLGAVFSAASALGSAMNSGTASSTQTASPSKTAQRLGGFYVDGYIDPAQKRLGEVRKAGMGIGGAMNTGAGSVSAVGPTFTKAPAAESVSAAGSNVVRAPVSADVGQKLSDVFGMMFADRRSPADAAASPIAPAASVGSAAANVTNATTTNQRGDVNVTLTANNADEGKMRAMITSTLRSLDIGG